LAYGVPRKFSGGYVRKRLANFGNELVFLATVLPLVMLGALGHALDVLTTWVAISFLGAREGNPMLAWFINSTWSGKWSVLCAMKAVVVGREVNLYLQDKSNEWSRYYYVRSAIFVCVVTWCVVMWNLSVIFRRRHAVRAGR